MKLADAAKLDNLKLLVGSGYRSYQYQSGLYNSYVARDGVIEADTYSARAGYSEHQTGLAIDVADGDKNIWMRIVLNMSGLLIMLISMALLLDILRIRKQ